MVELNEHMGHSIKMVDLHGQYLKIKEEVDQAIQGVIDSTSFISGESVSAFGSDLASYLGSSYVIPCANGTDALQIAYQTLDLKAGDEVIMPTFNYVSSAEAASLLGIKPVFVDVWEDTFNLNENLIVSKITSATKAIVVVHLFGQSANMEPILEIANQYGLKVIEDTAQSLGAEYIFRSGIAKKTGTMGDLSIHSFFPTKNLGCFGDGGAIATNSLELANRAKMITHHGQGKQKYVYEMIGCNSRLDTLQAAILRVKLKYLDSYLASRMKAGDYYSQLFQNSTSLIVPARSPFAKHTFNQYVLKIDKRDLLQEKLKALGIQTMIYYPSPLHLQPAFKYLNYQIGDFPISEKLCLQVLALPMHTELTLSEQDYISSTIHQLNNSL